MNAALAIVGRLAGKPVTAAELTGTLGLLRVLRRRGELSRLAYLVNVAINRKAGISDVACRKQDPDYQARLRRDAWRLRDIARRVRVYQFETPEVRDRFSHLLSRYDD
jgi:hypothetical protein